MSIADACLCELCPLGERILRKQKRNSREIPVLPMSPYPQLARVCVYLNKRVDRRLACAHVCVC